MTVFFQKRLDDILILAGSGLVIYATWLLSWIAAMYVAGVILIVLGVLVGLGNRPRDLTPNHLTPNPFPKGKGRREGEE